MDHFLLYSSPRLHLIQLPGSVLASPHLPGPVADFFIKLRGFIGQEEIIKSGNRACTWLVEKVPART
jgi:hypothetical protein